MDDINTILHLQKMFRYVNIVELKYIITNHEL